VGVTNDQFNRVQKGWSKELGFIFDSEFECLWDFVMISAFLSGLFG